MDKSEDKQLTYILKYDRDQLPSFLKKDYSYNHLINLLKLIESNNGVIADLFLGLTGLESNKQRAIYELPTYELLSVLKCICETLNIRSIEEIGSGQGLLAHMLNYHLNDPTYSVLATDGCRWIETSHNKKYYDVTNKFFLNYCLEELQDNKLLIVSWLPEDDIADFVKIVKTGKYHNIVIIGCPFSNYIYDLLIDLELSELGYKVIGMPIKQICFQDYFKDNKYFDNNCCRSTTILITSLPDNQVNNLLLTIKLKEGKNLCKKIVTIKDKIIIQDLIKSNKCSYLLPHLDNDNKLKKISKCFLEIIRDNYDVFPLHPYLKKYGEFVFWCKKVKEHKFPTNILTREKFKEYVRALNILNSDNGVTKLKEKGIISSWVPDNDKVMAEKCIWLDHSRTSKTWKQSINTFNTVFSQVFSLTNYATNDFL
ncbi:MAG: hypothetical protein Barrevirus4_8 [Barrevirus sp.]|uniref:Methyltransferase n=1 Tax=Barrevirus sp. TaxID=2487763 RepID=A0A3G4ZRG6_9VIRU|nr:MAG: hypothetical protein Barrevirus4_8 [Barrevirus sp.]